MSDVRNLKDTIVPKSNQLNSETLLTGPITIRVTAVSRGDSEQPVTVNYEGDDGRPYKPCKTCRKILIFAWGEDGSAWLGRSMTLYCDPSVKFGGVAVGGIRISHLSDIKGDIELSLTETKGRKAKQTIRRLTVTDATAEHRQRLQSAAEQGSEALKAAWIATPKPVRTALNPAGACPDELKAIAARADEETAPATDSPVTDVKGDF